MLVHLYAEDVPAQYIHHHVEIIELVIYRVWQQGNSPGQHLMDALMLSAPAPLPVLAEGGFFRDSSADLAGA